MENRSYNPEALELRAITDDDGKRYIQGYAAVFNSRSKLLSDFGQLFYEELEPGAFTNALNDDGLNVVFVANHNREQLLARSASGTLELKEDDRGLYFRADVPDTQLGNDVYTLVERGDLFENSFAFNLDSEGYRWTETDEEIPLRIISNVRKLMDVSVVTDGAYGETVVEARGLKEFVDSKNEVEEEVEETTDDTDDVKLRAKLIQLKNKNY